MEKEVMAQPDDNGVDDLFTIDPITGEEVPLTYDDEGYPVYPDEEPVTRGGPGSGHYGHAGRPGHVGGSLPGAGISMLRLHPDVASALAGTAHYDTPMARAIYDVASTQWDVMPSMMPSQISRRSGLWKHVWLGPNGQGFSGFETHAEGAMEILRNLLVQPRARLNLPDNEYEQMKAVYNNGLAQWETMFDWLARKGGFVRMSYSSTPSATQFERESNTSAEIYAPITYEVRRVLNEIGQEPGEFLIEYQDLMGDVERKRTYTFLVGDEARDAIGVSRAYYEGPKQDGSQTDKLLQALNAGERQMPELGVGVIFNLDPSRFPSPEDFPRFMADARRLFSKYEQTFGVPVRNIILTNRPEVLYTTRFAGDEDSRRRMDALMKKVGVEGMALRMMASADRIAMSFVGGGQSRLYLDTRVPWVDCLRHLLGHCATKSLAYSLRASNAWLHIAGQESSRRSPSILAEYAADIAAGMIEASDVIRVGGGLRGSPYSPSDADESAASSILGYISNPISAVGLPVPSEDKPALYVLGWGERGEAILVSGDERSRPPERCYPDAIAAEAEALAEAEAGRTVAVDDIAGTWVTDLEQQGGGVVGEPADGVIAIPDAFAGSRLPRSMEAAAKEPDEQESNIVKRVLDALVSRLSDVAGRM